MEKIALALSIIAIIINIVVIIYIFLLFKKNKYIKRNNLADYIYGEEFRHFIINTVTGSKTIRNYYEDLSARSITTNNNNSQNKIDEKQRNEIIDEVIETMKPIIQESIKEYHSLPKEEVVPKEKENTEKREKEKKTVMQKYGFFKTDSFAVSDSPDESTIFVFNLNPQDSSKASFEVYEPQKETVIADKNYLEGCCSIEGDGTHFQTIEKGQVFLSEGEWKLEKKLKIKFS